MPVTTLPASEPPTILVVDDNREILETTAQFLKDIGYRTVCSESAIGVSALTLEHHPAVLVLDVMMPALSGDLLAELMRSRNSTATVPIIFYSAIEEEQLYALTRRVSGATYVLK